MARGIPGSGGDTGSGEVGVSLGNASATGNITVSHTAFIIIGALILLWVMGAVVFKSIRM